MPNNSDRYSSFNGDDAYGLYLVRPAPSRVRPTCDIILLHGLNGGSAKTWRHGETGNIWFRDYLPDDIIDDERGLNARIWTYGYNANAAFQAAAGAHSFDFAHQLLERVAHIREGFKHHKIIWVCHSLGGIVVKTALIEARLNAEYTSILESTVGILFLGTPHQGSGVANVAGIAASIADTVLPGALFRSNRPLIKSLRQDCDGLFETAGRFANICTSIKIYNVYEMQNIGGRLIVERRSAVMNLQGEMQIPLNANHRTLCKFEDNNDNNYKVIRDVIQVLVRRSAVPNQSRAPYQPNPRPSHPSPRQQGPGSSASVNHASPTQRPWNPPYPSTTSSHLPTPPYPSTTSPRLPTNVPNPPTQTPQHDRGRPTPNYQPYRQPISVPTSVSQTNEASSPQPTSQETVRAVSAGPTSRSNPYSFVRPQDPIENLSAGFGAWRAFTDASQQQNPSRLSPDDAGGHRRAVSQPVSATEVPPEAPPSSGTTASNWICDGCRNPIPMSHARMHCLQCDDYDLCNNCFQAGRISDPHKSDHKTRHILRSFCFQQAVQDLVPPGEIVHPQKSYGRAQPNWSVEQDVRWHHLLENKNHARFFASSIEPGHYVMTFVIDFLFSSTLAQSHLDQLGESGFGNLRLAAGRINSKQQFFKERFLEDESLAGKLLNDGFYEDYIISFGQQRKVELKHVFHIESGPNAKAEFGFLMQWSEMQSFVGSDEPIVSISLNEVRLEDLLEYEVPSFSSSHPARPSTEAAAPPTAASPQPDPSTPADSSDFSYEDLFQAILDAAQEEQSKQEVEAFSAALIGELARRRQKQTRAQEVAEARALLQRMAYAEQVQRQRENYETLAQLGLLQTFLNGAVNR